MVNHKKLLFALVLITLVSNFCFSQENQNIENSQTNTESTADFEGWFGDDATADSSNTTAFKTVPTWKYLLRTVIVLILIAVAIYFIMRFFKAKGKIDSVKSDDGYLRRVSSLKLAPNKSIEVITIIDKGYLVGVTDENINLIAEIDDKELIEAMNINFNEAQNEKKPVNFNDVLKAFTTAGKNKNNIYGEVENKISNLDKNVE